MTRAEYARSRGITTEHLRREEMAFLQCEGYDDAGNVYDTLDAWLARRPVRDPVDQVDGGRGAGQYGREDQ